MNHNTNEPQDETPKEPAISFTADASLGMISDTPLPVRPMPTFFYFMVDDQSGVEFHFPANAPPSNQPTETLEQFVRRIVREEIEKVFGRKLVDRDGAE